MQAHELKCWPSSFEALIEGDKKHEVRKDDRNFRTGDQLFLREWDPETQEYTGRHAYFNVTYKTQPGMWGLPEDICVLSVEPAAIDYWCLRPAGA